MLRYAFEYKERVIDGVIKIIANHTTQALRQPSFLELDPELLLLIVQQDSLDITELDLFTKVVEWAKHNEKNSSRAGEVLKHIRYACIPQDELVGKVKPLKLAPMDLYYAALEYHCAPAVVKDQLAPLQAQSRSAPLLTNESFMTCNFEFAIAQSENARSHNGYFIMNEKQFSQLCPYFLQFHQQRGVPALDSFFSTNWAVRVASGKHIKFLSGFLSLQQLSITKGQVVPLQIHPSHPLPTDNYSQYIVTFAGSDPGSAYPVLCIKQTN